MGQDYLDERERIEADLESARGLVQAALLLIEAYPADRVTPRVQDAVSEILENLGGRLEMVMSGLQRHWQPMPGGGDLAGRRSRH